MTPLKQSGVEHRSRLPQSLAQEKVSCTSPFTEICVATSSQVYPAAYLTGLCGCSGCELGNLEPHWAHDRSPFTTDGTQKKCRSRIRQSKSRPQGRISSAKECISRSPFDLRYLEDNELTDLPLGVFNKLTSLRHL